MRTGWRYRIGSFVGVLALTIAAVGLANSHPLQVLFTTYVPVFWRLDPTVLTGDDLLLATWVTVFAVAVSLGPLYKPRPRRLLDIITLVHKRIVFAGCFLATLGFFNYSYRLPRATLVLICAILFVGLPGWFMLIRHRPIGNVSRAILVGDDPGAMETILETAELPILGYVAPPGAPFSETRPAVTPAVADGGDRAKNERSLDDLRLLGGFSRLDEVLVEHDVDTAVLAFDRPDRAEFFGALDACYEHGVAAKVHRRHADSVLTTGFGSGELVDIDLEPWDTLDHMIKRGFDVAFAVVGLLVLLPVAAAIVVAIKLDDGGSVLYSQKRTATFGETFTVYKFRSMVVATEDRTPIDDTENPHITRVGRVIRQTHLDEIPQLWSVLTGRMSVVGPRAAWVDEEVELEGIAADWRKRWFVKPGLTGLAQINDVSSTDPESKLRYDVEYIRRQSFWFDSKIVVRQLWQVFTDLLAMVR